MALRLFTSSTNIGRTKETAMQSLQLHLTGAARSWLSKLEKETIGSWGDLTKQFTSNFRSTYKRPASIEEVKACVQQRDETLRAYIQRWSLIKNSAVEVSDERAIDAFIIGLRQRDLVEEMRRIKPKTVSDLMDVANRFADGEDACNNKRTRSPEDDRRNRSEIKGDGSAITTTTAPIAKSPQGTKTTATKEAIAEVQDIKATEKRTIKSSPQENPESTTLHQKICSTNLVTYTQRSSTGSEYLGMQ
jgi:hypothetical protein